MEYVKKVLLDSGVVAGLLSLIGKAGAGELGLVVAGAAVAAAAGEMWEGARKSPVTPGDAVLKAIADFGLEMGDIEQKMRSIKLWQVQEVERDPLPEPKS